MADGVGQYGHMVVPAQDCVRRVAPARGRDARPRPDCTSDRLLNADSEDSALRHPSGQALTLLTGRVDRLSQAVQDMTTILGAFREEVQADRGIQLARHNGYVEDLNGLVEHLTESSQSIQDHFALLTDAFA